MSFSAEWLALREVADHRARDPELLAKLAEWAEAREDLTVADLGCGTGSNARAMIPHLSGRQHWRLVDNDGALLDLARERLAAESVHHLRVITVKTEEADLVRGLAAILADCDLVTAAALFDLVSKEWLDVFVTTLAERRLPLYTVLIYDGRMSWEPAHSADAAILHAFNGHQQRDKGFGPAAGPQAGAHLAERLAQAGYSVKTASSPWRLGADLDLFRAYAEGVAEAVGETGAIAPADLADWLAFRRKGGRATIGHVDLLALRPG